MPGQPWPSLALPLGSICCLWDDVKRNLPLLLLWTWKLALMEGSERSVGFSVLHTGLNSNANIILPNSDLIFILLSPTFGSQCQMNIWSAVIISEWQSTYIARGQPRVVQLQLPACWFLFCTSSAQHKTTAWLFYSSRNQAPRKQMPRRYPVQ